jgi:hypothetical protein
MKPNTGWDTSGILPGALFIGFGRGFQTMLWLQHFNTRLNLRANYQGRGMVLAMAIAGVVAGWSPATAMALPPPEDTPEEILRTQIIIKARSPIDGKPISAAEYAQLQEQLQDPNRTATVDSDFAQLIFLLQARRVIRPILPFFP